MKTDWSRTNKLVDNLITAGLQSLGDDVKKRAQILAPKDTGKLRRSAKVHLNSTKDTVTVSFNTEYARIREFSNKKHPATVGYLRNSLKSINNLNKYFKKF